MNPVPKSQVEKAESRPKPKSKEEFLASRRFKDLMSKEEEDAEYQVYLKFWRLGAWDPNSLRTMH